MQQSFMQSTQGLVGGAGAELVGLQCLQVSEHSLVDPVVLTRVFGQRFGE